MDLNNRELAVAIWLALLLALALFKTDVRRSLVSVLRAFAAPKILESVALLAAYTVALTRAGELFGLWNFDLLKGTLLWFIGSALVMFFNLSKTWEESGFFKRTFLHTVELTVFLAFFLNVLVFSLEVELVLQPALAFLGMMAVSSASKPEYSSAKRLVDAIMGISGFALLFLVLREFVRHWDDLEAAPLLLDFLLPIWMTIGVLPFIYILSLRASYQSAFLRINSALDDHSSRRRAKLALVSVAKGRVRRLRGFGGAWARDAGEASSFGDARRAIQAFLQYRQQEKAEAKDANARLKEYAGAVDTDSEGRQLDRREFNETIAALHWLATCQMGWYRNHGKRYRSELLQVLSDDFTRHGLPKEHGIQMLVSRGGRQWWAWRRTITGWCFAIGAAGPPPDQWEFDGPNPPRGFPGKDAAWGTGSFSTEMNPNW